MTTMQTQLMRLSKALCLMDQKHHPSIVPPQLLINCKGMMFFKKLPKGKQSQSQSQGIYFQKNGPNDWSQPLAVQLNKGDLYWSSQPSVERVDVMILIQDAKMAETLRCFGQVGFNSDSAERMKKGCCVENSEASHIKFAEVLSERPEILEGTAFSYGLCNGHFFPVDIETPVIRFRDSSNQKFYQTKNVDGQAIMRGDRVRLAPDQELMIEAAVKCVKRYFDIERRFPEYAGLASPKDSESESASSAAASPSSAASPNPVNELGSPNPSLQQPPTFGAGDRVPHLNASQRQWSSSDASYSSTGSDDDRARQFNGYVPGGSYDSWNSNTNSLAAGMAAMQVKEQPSMPPAQPLATSNYSSGATGNAYAQRPAPAPPAAQPSPIRERASSFDFGM